MIFDGFPGGAGAEQPCAVRGIWFVLGPYCSNQTGPGAEQPCPVRGIWFALGPYGSNQTAWSSFSTWEIQDANCVNTRNQGSIKHGMNAD